MDAEGRKILLQAARAIADYLGDEFIGQIQINIHKGGVGSISFPETIRPEKGE